MKYAFRSICLCLMAGVLYQDTSSKVAAILISALYVGDVISLSIKESGGKGLLR